MVLIFGSIQRRFSRLEWPSTSSPLAILDVNINGEEAYPIADALAASGIPFIFATGYDKNSLSAPYGDRPTLQKPFQRHDLQKLFAELSL